MNKTIVSSRRQIMVLRVRAKGGWHHFFSFVSRGGPHLQGEVLGQFRVVHGIFRQLIIVKTFVCLSVWSSTGVGRLSTSAFHPREPSGSKKFPLHLTEERMEMINFTWMFAVTVAPGSECGAVRKILFCLLWLSFSFFPRRDFRDDSISCELLWTGAARHSVDFRLSESFLCRTRNWVSRSVALRDSAKSFESSEPRSVECSLESFLLKRSAKFAF